MRPDPKPLGYLPLLEIARGGIGQVELCVRREGAFERLYAVKRLHPHLREDEEFRSMFLDEARIAGLLRHANVISVVDVGEDGQGPFLVMDYIEGVSLRQLIRASGPANLLPISVCVEIATQVARGLHAAHELRSHEGEPLNLIHRDVSPQNIIAGYDGVVRVGDFGIAKALGQRSQTSTGMLKGKTGYFSPEQLRFEVIDRRSDIFSLGIVLYEMVSGQRLYGGGTGTDAFRRILHEPVPEIGAHRRDVPPPLEELLFDLLAKSPHDRPEDASDVAERLMHLAQEFVHDDAVHLEAFLAERFAATRAENRQKVTAALEGVTVSNGRRRLRSEAPPRHTSTDTSRAGRRKRPAAWLVLLAGVVLGGVVVGLPSLFHESSEAQGDAATGDFAGSRLATPPRRPRGGGPESARSALDPQDRAVHTASSEVRRWPKPDAGARAQPPRLAPTSRKGLRRRGRRARPGRRVATPREGRRPQAPDLWWSPDGT